ncbi:DUF1643 domain-containing protein, partial [Bacillus sp. B-TM1]
MKIGKKKDYGEIVAPNLFGYITSAPKQLFKKENIIGRQNDKYIKEIIKGADKIVCVW